MNYDVRFVVHLLRILKTISDLKFLAYNMKYSNKVVGTNIPYVLIST